MKEVLAWFCLSGPMERGGFSLFLPLRTHGRREDTPYMPPWGGWEEGTPLYMPP